MIWYKEIKIVEAKLVIWWPEWCGMFHDLLSSGQVVLHNETFILTDFQCQLSQLVPHIM